MTEPPEGSIVAAGGWCAPNESIYELDRLGLYGDLLPEKRTPEEWAAIEAEQKARVEAEFAVAQQRYFEVRDEIINHMAGPTVLRSALQSMVERHQPKVGSYQVECRCWHNSGYEVDPAKWPCPDFNNVARAVGL